MCRKNIYLLLILIAGALYFSFRLLSSEPKLPQIPQLTEKTTSSVLEIQNDVIFDRLIGELNAVEIDASKFSELVSKSNESQFFNSMLDFDHDTRTQKESEYITLFGNNMVSRQGDCLKLQNSKSHTLMCNVISKDAKENINFFFAGKSDKYFIILKEEYEDNSYVLVDIETLKNENYYFTSIAFSDDENRALTVARDPYDSVFIYSVINFTNPSANIRTNWIQNWEIENVYWNKSELVFSAKNTDLTQSSGHTNERYGFVK
ncbi:MAG: hypothetical protein KBC42_02425 [Candidatus Pacebacteria bacterium]|nr:hypothetical protein [Candidatus Paceibacterota bacterium]